MCDVRADVRSDVSKIGCKYFIEGVPPLSINVYVQLVSVDLWLIFCTSSLEFVVTRARE